MSRCYGALHLKSNIKNYFLLILRRSAASETTEVRSTETLVEDNT